jgi:hypothetical protein
LDLTNGPRAIPQDATAVLGDHLPSYAEDLWQIMKAHWSLPQQMAFARMLAYSAAHS